MSSDYERQRELNILANKALLAQLGLEKPLPPSKPPPASKKRKAVAASPQRKSARVARGLQDRDDTAYASSESSSDTDSDYGGKEPRKRRLRSSAVKRRRASFSAVETTDGDAAGLRRRIVNGRSAQHISRTHVRPDPKVHGAIAGTRVGKWWPTRLACGATGVHPPPVSGIYGSGATGAFSVALSGGYEDDIDEGFRFTYTGSGGRDLKGTVHKPKNLRTAPQSCDQTLSGGNLALKRSCETGLPVRVIRGYKAELGPAQGYRYDGLYTVVKAWQGMGLAGFKVWRFAFKRVDGQAPVRFDAGVEDEDYGESDEGEGGEGEGEGEEVKEEEDSTDVKDGLADIKNAEDSADELAVPEAKRARKTKIEETESEPETKAEEIESEPETKTEIKLESERRAKPKVLKKAARKAVGKATPKAEPTVNKNTRKRARA